MLSFSLGMLEWCARLRVLSFDHLLSVPGHLLLYIAYTRGSNSHLICNTFFMVCASLFKANTSSSVTRDPKISRW